MRNTAVRHVAVWFGEGFEVSRARGDTTAADFPFGNQHLAEARVVVKFTRHLLRGEGDCVVVGVGSLDELVKTLVSLFHLTLIELRRS